MARQSRGTRRHPLGNESPLPSQQLRPLEVAPVVGRRARHRDGQRGAHSPGMARDPPAFPLTSQPGSPDTLPQSGGAA